MVDSVVIMVAVTKVVGSGDFVVVSVLNSVVVTVLTKVKVEVFPFLRVVSTEVTVCVVGCILTEVTVAVVDCVLVTIVVATREVV